jgi:transposase
MLPCMTSARVWVKRVEQWRASGQSPEAYAAGRDFGAGSLRYWARKTELEQRDVPATPLRFARVIRRATPSPLEVTELVPSVIVVERAGTRISVAPGFDRAALRAVLEVLSDIERGAAG